MQISHSYEILSPSETTIKTNLSSSCDQNSGETNSSEYEKNSHFRWKEVVECIQLKESESHTLHLAIQQNLNELQNEFGHEFVDYLEQVMKLSIPRYNDENRICHEKRLRLVKNWIELKSNAYHTKQDILKLHHEKIRLEYMEKSKSEIIDENIALKRVLEEIKSKADMETATHRLEIERLNRELQELQDMVSRLSVSSRVNSSSRRQESSQLRDRPRTFI